MSSFGLSVQTKTLTKVQSGLFLMVGSLQTTTQDLPLKSCAASRPFFLLIVNKKGNKKMELKELLWSLQKIYPTSLLGLLSKDFIPKLADWIEAEKRPILAKFKHLPDRLEAFVIGDIHAEIFHYWDHMKKTEHDHDQ